MGEDLASFLIDNCGDDLPSYYARGYKRGKFPFARGWLDWLRIHSLSPLLAKALADAPATRLLRTLEIDRFSDDCAECHRLLAGSSYLVNLRTLDLSADGIAAPRATGVNLLADNQRDPDGEEEIDEGHYLREGDWE